MYTTHNSAVRTITHNDTKSKRLKVLPQLSSELWGEILRHRSMQIAVLREERFNRHGELGYHAVLDELNRLSYECQMCFHAPVGCMYCTPWWITMSMMTIKDVIPGRGPRKANCTKNGSSYCRTVVA
jgi:hypothetical protein